MKKISLLLVFFTIATTLILSCSETDETPVANITTPVLTSPVVSAITGSSATATASVTSNGGSTVTARGFCWAVTPVPTIAGEKTTQNGDTGEFTGSIQGLQPNTQYFIRSYATNSQGTAYGNQSSFVTGDTPAETGVPVVTTAAVSAITQTTAASGGNVTDDGGSPILERGICWATTQLPTIDDDMATATGTTGSFTSAIAGLTAGTTYYVRAFATNANGTSYGNQLNFTTTAVTEPVTPGPVGGSAVCNGTQPTTVVQITSSTGKIWMDRNLGASRAATSSTDFEAYGCLYQWGRGNDGHGSITWVMGQDDDWGNLAGTPVNGSTYTLSNSDTPPNALFIKDETSIPYDWRSPKNDNLWQGANGINNPCPTGFRVPTKAEFQAEITSYSITGPTSAFNSIHKFPVAGLRAFDSGALSGQGEHASFWTSTTDGSDSFNVRIQPGAVYTNVGNGRAGGYSVRCIKN